MVQSVTWLPQSLTTSTSASAWRFWVIVVQIACACGFVVALMRPIEVPDPLGVGSRLSWTVICLATATAILIAELFTGGWPATALYRPVAAYVVIVAATTISSVDRSTTLIWILSLAGNIGIFVSVVTLVRKVDWLSEAMLVFLVADIALLVLMATGYHAEVGLLARPTSYPIPEGWGGYPELATLGAVQFGLLVAAVQTGKHWAGVTAAGILGVITVVEIAFLYARGAWLAVVLVLAVAGALAGSRGHVKRAVVGAVLVLGLAGGLAVSNPTLRFLILGGPRPTAYNLAVAAPEMRLRLYTRTLRMIAEHAFVGVGLGNFQRVFEQTHKPEISNEGRSGVHAHNLWLHQYAELGVIGGTAYLVLWMWVFRLAWARAREAPSFLSVGLLLSLTAMIGCNLTTVMFYQPGQAAGRLHSLTWVLWALVAATASSAASPPAAARLVDRTDHL